MRHPSTYHVVSDPTLRTHVERNTAWALDNRLPVRQEPRKDRVIFSSIAYGKRVHVKWLLVGNRVQRSQTVKLYNTERSLWETMVHVSYYPCTKE